MSLIVLVICPLKSMDGLMPAAENNSYYNNDAAFLENLLLDFTQQA